MLAGPARDRAGGRAAALLVAASRRSCRRRRATDGRCRTSTRCRCISAAGSTRNTPPTARIAVNDIGAIAYFSRREVIDLMGLVTPEIIPYPPGGRVGRDAIPRGDCPDYVIIFPAWFPTSRRWPSASSPSTASARSQRGGGRRRAGGRGVAAEMVVYRLAALWRYDRRHAADRVLSPGIHEGRSVLAVILALGSLLSGASRRRRADLPLDRRARRGPLRRGHRQRPRPLSRRAR